MHDKTARSQPQDKPPFSTSQRRSACPAQPAFSDHRIICAATRAGTSRILRSSIRRRRRQRRCRHPPQLGGARCGRMVPRYGVMPSLPSARSSCSAGDTPRRSVSRRWAVRPSYGPAPTASRGAAQRARIPYTLSTAGRRHHRRDRRDRARRFLVSALSLPNNDHALGFDLVRRAEAAGCRALVLTLDVPVRTTRPREVATGIAGAFNVDLRIMSQIARAPAWAAAVWKYGVPRFANLRSYAGGSASLNEVIAFAQREMGGAFTWDEVRKYRDRWKGPLLVKGIMHPQDAERAVSLGIDGIIVSNHGGRQVEALPASVDALPAIVRQVRGRATVIMDFRRAQRQRRGAGLRAGRIGRVCGQGVSMGPRRAGRGRPRACHRPSDRRDQSALGQLGAHDLEELRALTIRHPGALTF